MLDQVECVRIQQQQFQILSYIYLDEFHVLKQTAPFKFSILCRPYVRSHELEYQMNIEFELPKNYPNVPLKYEIQPIVGITRDNINEITRKAQDLIYENRSQPIVYQIVEEIRLWIFEYLVQGKAYQSAEESTKKVEEVFERPKFSAFTPVTIENFLNWKKQFDAKQKAKLPFKKEGQVKITGKQWFLGRKQEEIIDTQEQDSEEDEEIQEEDEGLKVYQQPQNKLFTMAEEQK